jgi:hypothetical protein
MDFVLNNNCYFCCAEEVLRHCRRNGPTFVMWQGWKPFVIITEPEGTPARAPSNHRTLTPPFSCGHYHLHTDVRKLLTDKEELFYKSRALGANPTLPRVIGTSLLTVAGDKWKAQRKAMDPAFQYSKMRTLVPMFAHCTRKLIAKWEQQCDQPVKVEPGLTEMTLDAIGSLPPHRLVALPCPRMSQRS